MSRSPVIDIGQRAGFVVLDQLVLGPRRRPGNIDWRWFAAARAQGIAIAPIFRAQRALEGTGLGFVPTVIAEPGSDGSALSRLGVGVLPSFLGNRVYLEGTYNNSQATGQGYQFLIDATLNDHFSIGGVIGGSSAYGQRFGVDFFYAP